MMNVLDSSIDRNAWCLKKLIRAPVIVIYIFRFIIYINQSGRVFIYKVYIYTGGGENQLS